MPERIVTLSFGTWCNLATSAHHWHYVVDPNDEPGIITGSRLYAEDAKAEAIAKAKKHYPNHRIVWRTK